MHHERKVTCGAAAVRYFFNKKYFLGSHHYHGEFIFDSSCVIRKQQKCLIVASRVLTSMHGGGYVIAACPVNEGYPRMHSIIMLASTSSQSLLLTPGDTPDDMMSTPLPAEGLVQGYQPHPTPRSWQLRREA